MTLRLRLKASSSVPLEVEGVTPDSVRGKSLSEIEKLVMFQGNLRLPLAEVFGVSGNADDGVIEWEGNLAGVHWIGAKMATGKIVIAGNCGRHLGSEMRGGEIQVQGSAGDWVGGEMQGGFIHVHGDAGHLVGAAYRGSAVGMTNGTILVGGNAGNEIGHSMRRGLIAIGGNSGDLAGFNMLAGTILLFGETGIRHGAGMKRGTIGFFGRKRPPILPTFRHACRCQPDVLPLLLRELHQRQFAVSDDLFTSFYDLYNGDLIEGGRGEILMRTL
jgi:formylmethanofuran dehydrogenase subunit C